ncbi:hypothetical protein F3157_02555 [Virgibacillus dakarensis]|nr:hypothetical protein [Virgibacillus dakarensis]
MSFIAYNRVLIGNHWERCRSSVKIPIGTGNRPIEHEKTRSERERCRSSERKSRSERETGRLSMRKPIETGKMPIK